MASSKFQVPLRTFISFVNFNFKPRPSFIGFVFSDYGHQVDIIHRAVFLHLYSLTGRCTFPVTLVSRGCGVWVVVPVGRRVFILISNIVLVFVLVGYSSVGSLFMWRRWVFLKCFHRCSGNLYAWCYGRAALKFEITIVRSF